MSDETQPAIGVPFAPLERADCYLRALAGEPRFTLIGRDRHAPRLLRHWADLRESEGEDAATVADVRRIARDMDEYRDGLVQANLDREAARIAQAHEHQASEEGLLRSAVSAFKRHFR